MSGIVERVPNAHRHVNKGFAIHDFDPDRERLPTAAYVSYKAGGGYVFSFVPVRLPSGRFRAYIRTYPSYNGRDTGSGTVHRLVDRHGYYICWAPEPPDSGGLIRVMRVWAESTAGYIATGRFAPIGRP